MCTTAQLHCSVTMHFIVFCQSVGNYKYALTDKLTINHMLFSITACIKVYLKEAYVCQESCSFEPMSNLELVTMRNIPFCVLIWPSRYLYLLISVKKQGLSGRLTPQWHLCYSVALLTSVSLWLPQKISHVNTTLTQKFPKIPVMIFIYLFGFLFFFSVLPASIVHEKCKSSVCVYCINV